MRPRLLVVSQQFPSKALPTRATYNRQQYLALSEFAELKVVVPVSFTERVKFGTSSLVSVVDLDVEYITHVYTPRILREWYPRMMAFSIRRLNQIVSEFQPDAIVASWLYPDAAAVEMLTRELGVRLFVQVLGSDYYLHASYPGRRNQIKKLLQAADGAIAVSNALERQLISCGANPKTTFTVYNGVDSNLFGMKDKLSCRAALPVEIAHDQRCILFVGNLKREKGVFDLLEAYEKVAVDSCEPPALIYVGNDVDKVELESEVAKLEKRLDDCQVHLVGSRPHDELSLWINAADVICLPSYSEGVPNVVLESLRCGQPVVCSNVGGIPEIVTESNGLLVEAGAITELAHALTQALAREWNRQEIFEFSKRFDWQMNARKMCEILFESNQ